MMVFLGVFNNFLSTVCIFLYKKALTYNPNLTINALAFAVYYFIAGGLFLLFVGLENFVFFPAFVLAAGNFIRYITTVYNQKVYQNEKISVLAPFGKLNTVIGMIVAFILLGGVSFFSFCIALSIVFITIFPSINFKQKTFSKTLLLFIFIQITRGIIYVSEGWVILHMTAFDFFTLNIFSFGIGGLLFTLIFKWKDLKIENFKLPKEYHIIQFIDNVIEIGTCFLTSFLIVNLGLIVSSILGFLGTGMNLLMSFFMFGDKPSKKDLILTGVITILVFIGFYFK